MEYIIDLSGIFSGCNLLITLPDISKWDTSKVNYMNNFLIAIYY